jgi:hypothetical protein
METLSTALRYEASFLLIGLAAVVGYQLFTGKIRTKGLLADKAKEHKRGISPGRLQAFIVTLLMAIYYVTKVIENQKLPNIPTEYLLALGGSHSFYLGGKIFGLLASKLELAAARSLRGPVADPGENAR